MADCGGAGGDWGRHGHAHGLSFRQPDKHHERPILNAHVVIYKRHLLYGYGLLDGRRDIGIGISLANRHHHLLGKLHWLERHGDGERDGHSYRPLCLHAIKRRRRISRRRQLRVANRHRHAHRRRDAIRFL